MKLTESVLAPFIGGQYYSKHPGETAVFLGEVETIEKTLTGIDITPSWVARSDRPHHEQPQWVIYPSSHLSITIIDERNVRQKDPSRIEIISLIDNIILTLYAKGSPYIIDPETVIGYRKPKK